MAITNDDIVNECSVCLESFDNDENKAVIFNCELAQVNYVQYAMIKYQFNITNTKITQ